MSAFDNTGMHAFDPSMIDAPQEDFQIVGTDCQIVQMRLEPQQEVVSEAGAMCFMSENVKQSIRFGSMASSLKRGLGGEGLAKSVWKNESSSPGFIGFTSSLPGTVMAVNLQNHPKGIKCKSGAFICSSNNETEWSVGLLKAEGCCAACMLCCCSDMGVILQSLRGGSWTFIGGHGTLISKELAEGEEIVVDTNAVIAMDDAVTVDIRCVGNCGMVCCSNEGLTNTVLIGPGLVVLQSLPLEKLRVVIMEWVRRNRGQYYLRSFAKFVMKSVASEVEG